MTLPTACHKGPFIYYVITFVLGVLVDPSPPHMESIMDLYFCTQNLVTTQKYFAVPILTEVARSASCSGVKGVIPARVDRVRPGLSISSIFSDVFRHLPSCQALPRAPLSGHRGSELWDGKELYLRSLCLSVTLLKEIFNGQSHSSG